MELDVKMEELASEKMIACVQAYGKVLIVLRVFAEMEMAVKMEVLASHQIIALAQSISEEVTVPFLIRVEVVAIVKMEEFVLVVLLLQAVVLALLVVASEIGLEEIVTYLSSHVIMVFVTVLMKLIIMLQLVLDVPVILDGMAPVVISQFVQFLVRMEVLVSDPIYARVQVHGRQVTVQSANV